MYFFGTSIEHSSTPAALQKIGTCRGANFASLFFTQTTKPALLPGVDLAHGG